MKFATFLILAAATAGAARAASPVPLQPMGLPFFAPENPHPVAPDHPLYHAIALEPVASMPAKVGKFLIPITNAKEVNEAFRDAFERANMLAPTGVAPKAVLRIEWLGLDAPQKISASSEARSNLRYTLSRATSGERLFGRDISTFSRSTGGEASDRLKDNARLAIMTNVASAVLCLDKSAYQRAPADCALSPLASYRAHARDRHLRSALSDQAIPL